MGKQSRAKRKRVPKKEPVRQIPKWLIPAGLVGLVLGTFLIRTLPGWSEVFVDGNVWFRGTDAWYHMRLVDNMMVNFPIPLRWDMAILFPEGMGVGYFPLLSWIVAIPGQLFNYEAVGALLPPILGALVLIPVFFICKLLWKDWVGLIACLLIMILPTEFFHRSLLGFTDHHILEVFFMTTTILFLILIQKREKLRWVILAGVSLGLYLSSWAGGLLLTVPIVIWFFITFLYKLKKKETVWNLCRNLTLVFGIGTLLYLPNLFLMGGIESYLLIMGILTATPLILYQLSKLWNWKVLLGVVSGCILAGILVVSRWFPYLIDLVRSVVGYSSTTTIQEAMPSYPKLLMNAYGISFALFIGGLVLAIKKKENLLVLIWCITMLILVLGQRRWGYYFTIGNAIMAGYFIYLIVGWMHEHVRIAVVTVICALLLFTTLPSTIGISKVPNYMLGGWYNACVWLKNNTPEIEGYNELDADPPEYGIIAWWDYGNWITRIGRRVPMSNPMAQTPRVQWKVFLAHSEEEAENYLEGIEYIMVSEAEVTGKFHAIVRLSHLEEINWEPFIVTLWNEENLNGWIKIHQEGGIKIYGRT